MDYLYIMFIFCGMGLAFLKMYLKHYRKKYFYDKKYFWCFHIGFFSYVLFIMGFVLDYGRYLKIVIYTFPLWSVGPTLFFYGIRRLMLLELKNNDCADVNVTNKKLENINSRIKSLYVIAVISVCFWIFLIIDGRM